MENKDNSERIEKFLREQMTPEENELFLKDLKSDKELREEAQMIALLIKEMKEEQAQKDAKIIKEVLVSKKRVRIIQMIRWMASIAAIFLLIFGVYTYQSNFTEEEGTKYIALADKYYNQTPKALYRTGTNDLEHELDSLFAKVGTSKEVTSTISRLQEIHESIDSVYVYSVNGNDILIKWFLALAFLKDGQKEKATELLSAIVKDDKGTFLKEEAEQLLKDIDKQ